LAIPQWGDFFGITQSELLRSQGRANTDITNETSNAAIGNAPNISGQIIKMIIVPIMIPTPDQKKAFLIVVIMSV
jgi:hypothetical protein